MRIEQKEVKEEELNLRRGEEINKHGINIEIKKRERETDG